MRNHVIGKAGVLCGLAVLAVLAAGAVTTGRAGEKSPIDPCLGCHAEETPAVVEQWRAGKHAPTGVKCYVCHFAAADNPAGEEHNGFAVVTTPDIATCESCHPEKGAELRQKFIGTDLHP